MSQYYKNPDNALESLSRDLIKFLPAIIKEFAISQ